MPELPEVETVLQGIKPHLEGTQIQKVVVRESSLRWPIPSTLPSKLTHQHVGKLLRRGKYILMPVGCGTVIIHLGMSGYLSILDDNQAPLRHDHVDIAFSNGRILRYTDPRRFGCILWTEESPVEHKLINRLGPEPLSTTFSVEYLMKVLKGRGAAIKTLIMNSQVVVGVGNIYAAEALFMAGIHPLAPGKSLSQSKCERLVTAIRNVLQAAIQLGGTTINDFINSDGKPGYFVNELQVYGRDGLPCVTCKTSLELIKLGQRSTVYCPRCQSSKYFAM